MPNLKMQITVWLSGCNADSLPTGFSNPKDFVILNVSSISSCETQLMSEQRTHKLSLASLSFLAPILLSHS